MPDYFELLGFPRSPWLDPVEVKARFAECSGAVHPDRVHQADESTRTGATRHYAELNAAQQCLLDPRKRLGHLLELETGELPGDVGSVPARISELFFDVGKALRATEQMLERKRSARSPMVQAQIMREVLAGSDLLQQLERELERRHLGADKRCRELGNQWIAGERDLVTLRELYLDFRYLGRWLDQLRERRLQLML
jgi:DnaJ-domain-containing protein 1